MSNTYITREQILWNAGAGDHALYFCGPSHNALVEQGDDSSAQIKKLGMGSTCYFGDDMKLSFVLKVDSNANYYHPSILPRVEIDKNGKIVVGNRTTVSGQDISAYHYISGKTDGDTAYIVLEITNHTASNINVTPTIILSDINLQNFRWKDVGNTGNDSISWDNTNKYLEITSAGISNLYTGIRACNSIQHYQAQSEWSDVRATLASGDLGDSIGTVGSSNYIWVQHGETSNPTAIANGATGTFVWAIGAKSTQASLQTLMAGLGASPTSDLSASDAFFEEISLETQIPTLPDLDRLLNMNLMRSFYQANSMEIGGYKNAPAGSYTFTFPFARDGYYSHKSLLQINTGNAITLDEYNLFKDYENVDNSQEHEIAKYVNSSGVYVTSGNNGSPGDQDFYQILKAYEYYINTQSASFLSSEISSLNEIFDYIKGYYDSSSKFSNLFPGHGTSTYLDGDGNITGENPIHDPVVVSLCVYSMERLSELNTLAGNSSKATDISEFANTLRTASEAMWNNSASWPYFNIKTDGTLYDNRHLAKCDAALWDVLADTSKAAMASGLAGNEWWNSSGKYFYEMPTTDSLYDENGYWYGKGWNMTDYKAFETIFRFGNASEARTAFKWLKQHTQERLDDLKGNMAEKEDNAGIFGFSIGAMIEMVVRGIFGIDMHADYFTISPNTHKFGVGGVWKLSNLRMGNKVYNISVSGSGSVQSNYLGNISYSDEETDIAVTFSGRQLV